MNEGGSLYSLHIREVVGWRPKVKCVHSPWLPAGNVMGEVSPLY